MFNKRIHIVFCAALVYVVGSLFFGTFEIRPTGFKDLNGLNISFGNTPDERLHQQTDSQRSNKMNLQDEAQMTNSKTIFSKLEEAFGSDCEGFFAAKYSQDPNWNNLHILDFVGDNDAIFSTAIDLQKQMYMLKQCPHLLHSYPDLFTRVYPYFKQDILESWPKYEGRGIVLTFPSNDIDVAKRLIRVIRTQSNLPIEIMHYDEIPGDVDFGAHVKTVDFKPYMKENSRVGGFASKWPALLLSSFEEVIFMDVDAVPFISMDSFFDMYDGTMLLFFDRQLANVIKKESCEPFMNLPREDKSKSMIGFDDAPIRERFFGMNEKEIIDSGIVVVNKTAMLPSLLAGFNFNMFGSTHPCMWGDKEHFWLGAVWLDQPVNIFQEPAAMIGSIRDDQMCSCQIAHTDKGKLIWVNGGVSFCKKEGSWNDDEDKDYFKDRFQTSEKIKEFYQSPVELDAIISPEALANIWSQAPFCKRHCYCVKTAPATVIRYSDKIKNHINGVIDTWFGINRPPIGVDE